MSFQEDQIFRSRGPKRADSVMSQNGNYRMSLRLARAKSKKNMSELEVKDIEKFDQEYTLLEKIGQGNYGSVYKAQHNRSGTYVAVKSVYTLGYDMKELEKEIDIMKGLDSDYIVRYFGTFFKDHTCWIIMEYCFFGSCGDIMNVREQPYKEKEIRVICKDVLKGLSYLHAQQRIHRDVKADNIMVNDRGEMKLADFGVSGKGNKLKTVIGTPFFVAPEIILNEGFYNCKVDIWSLGITAIELAEMLPPYANDPPMKVLFNIPTKPPPTLTTPDLWSKEFNEFVSKCLTKDPESRCSADELLECDFIKHAGVNTEIMSEIVQETALLIDKYFTENEEETEEEEDLETQSQSGTLPMNDEHDINKNDNNNNITSELKLKDGITLEEKIFNSQQEVNNKFQSESKSNEIESAPLPSQSETTQGTILDQLEKQTILGMIKTLESEIEEEEKSIKIESELILKEEEKIRAEEALLAQDQLQFIKFLQQSSSSGENSSESSNLELKDQTAEGWVKFIEKMVISTEEKRVIFASNKRNTLSRKKLTNKDRTVSVGKTLKQIMEDETKAIESRLEKDEKEKVEKERKIKETTEKEKKKMKKESRKSKVFRFFSKKK